MLKKPMNDLLQSQIRGSCNLALPEGLKDLMCDISREVLRAQPPNLYNFITSYLADLLVVRANLLVANHVCGALCGDLCSVNLEVDLRNLGLFKEDINTVVAVVDKHFKTDPVKETSIMSALVRKLPHLQESHLLAIKEAIKQSYLTKHKKDEWSSSSGIDNLGYVDDVTCAVHHTLRLYRTASPTEAQYHHAAVTIQRAYRAYHVRRHCRLKDLGEKTKAQEQDLLRRNIRFGSIDSDDGEHKEILSEEIILLFENAQKSASEVHQILPPPSHHSQKLVSSTSLAGSFVNLPKYKPYCVHEPALHELDEIPEKEHATIDYTEEFPQRVFAKEQGSFTATSESHVSERSSESEDSILEELDCSGEGEEEEEVISEANDSENS